MSFLNGFNLIQLFVYMYYNFLKVLSALKDKNEWPMEQKELNGSLLESVSSKL